MIKMNPLIPAEIREQHGYYVALTIMTILDRIDMIDNLVKQFDLFIGDPVEFIVFTEGLNDVVVVSHFRSKCKHRVFIRNIDDYTRKDREYLTGYGGGYLCLYMEQDEEIDKKNLDEMLSLMITQCIPNYYKEGKLKIVNKEESRVRDDSVRKYFDNDIENVKNSGLPKSQKEKVIEIIENKPKVLENTNIKIEELV